jgi:hypothetical protein
MNVQLSDGEVVIVATELDLRATDLEGQVMELTDQAGALSLELSLINASIKHYSARATLLRRVAERIRYKADHGG